MSTLLLNCVSISLSVLHGFSATSVLSRILFMLFHIHMLAFLLLLLPEVLSSFWLTEAWETKRERTEWCLKNLHFPGNANCCDYSQGKCQGKKCGVNVVFPEVLATVGWYEFFCSRMILVLLGKIKTIIDQTCRLITDFFHFAFKKTSHPFIITLLSVKIYSKVFQEENKAVS